MQAILLLVVGIGILLEILSLMATGKGLTYSCKPSQHIIEPDTPVDIEIRVSNRKLLPVAFLQLEEELPLHILYQDELQPTLSHVSHLREHRTVFVGSWQTLIKKIPVKRLPRGVYSFPGATLTAGDFFGLYTKDTVVEQNEELLVYPAPIANPDLTHALRQVIGDIIVTSPYLEDPSSVAGYRDYTGREPMKQISWPQSARRGKIIAKEYDHTRQLTATILLDNFCPYLTSELRVYMEGCYSIIRYCCEQMNRNGLNYSFYTNATLSNIEKQELVSSSLPGAGQNSRTLEILSRCATSWNCNLLTFMEHIVKVSVKGSCFLLISPARDKRVTESLDYLKAHTTVPVYVLYGEDYFSKEV